MREGKLGLMLRHPNIVPIYEVAAEGKSPYLVMEFVEGWNLRDLVRIRTKLEPLQATQLMMGLVEGLRYAFEHGLTHRDLKLNNVLVSSALQAKLVDFGLAALDDNFGDERDDDMPNTRTIDYAALERATGVRKDDTRSDIYFMGCIFYNMLTGQPPLMETKDRMQRLNKQRFLDVIPIQKADPTLPHWVCTVVTKAMMLDLARRYQSPAAMLANLVIAERQLIEGGDAVSAEAAEAAMGTYVETKQHTVLVVESNPKWQRRLPRRLQAGQLSRAGDRRSRAGRCPLAPGQQGGAVHRLLCARAGRSGAGGFQHALRRRPHGFRSGRALVGRTAEGMEGEGLRGRTSHRAHDAHHHERPAEQAGRADGSVIGGIRAIRGSIRGEAQCCCSAM